MLLRSNFSSFPQYFQYISNVKSPITYKFVKCGGSNYFFLNSENLICRGTDILKCFRESLGLQDNESRLYILCSLGKIFAVYHILVHSECAVMCWSTVNSLEHTAQVHRLVLTYLSLASHKRNIGKQCRPRPDAAESGI